MTELPLAPDQALLERLQRSVEFFEHAKSHVTGGTTIDRMVAVHGLDNSVEYLLRIVLDAFDVEARTNKNLDTVELASLFSEVYDFIRNEYELRLPYRAEIKKLRKLRNLVQHGMVDPIADLGSLSTIVTRFFDFIFNNLFGVEPKDLRLSQLVHDVVVQEFLTAAEAHIDAKDYLAAVVASRDAFQNAFYERRRYSNLRLNAIPVLLEPEKTTTTSFYSGIVDEVEQLRFGLDTKKFDRFQEYLRHIPYDHHAEWQGNTVMQRPWRREDAEFCYRFAAQTAVQWQNTELDPLYKSDSSDLPNWIEHFAGVTIPESGHLISYPSFDENTGEIEVFVVDEALKESLANLPLNREYDYVHEQLKEGKLKSRQFQRVELRNRIVRLLTHNPARWEVILYFFPIALTRYGQDFEEDKLKSETPCINTADADEIVGIYPDVMTEEIASKIIEVRERQGQFRTRQDLRQVPEISEQQIDWICRSTRAEATPPLGLEAVPLNLVK